MKLTYIVPLLSASAGVLSYPAFSTSESTNSTLEIRDEDLAHQIPTTSDLKITMYEKPGCKGQDHTYENIRYGHRWAKKDWPNGGVGIRSYWLSRDLQFEEHLDWRLLGTNADGKLDKCAKYYKSAPTKQSKGCQPLGTVIRCWELWYDPRATDKHPGSAPSK